MLHGRQNAALWISWLGLLAICVVHASAAEYRTSVRGKPLVRAASYEETVEQQGLWDEQGVWDELGGAEGPLAGPVEPGWSGDCDPCTGAGCGPSCAAACAPCTPCWTYWGTFDFLLWWRKGQDLPPLVTSSTPTTDAASAGVLGQPGTQILYATNTQTDDARPGGRLTAGIWFDPCQFSGAGTRLFALGESTAHFDQNSDVVPVLARPFFNLERGIEDAALIAFPDLTTGSIAVRNTSRVSGGDVFYRRLLFQAPCRRLDLVAGYQFARIDTDITIASTLESISQGGTIPLGTVVEVTDLFETENTYNAGEIGLWGTYERGPITWNLLAKVGLGNMHQRIRIAGQTVTTAPGQPPAISSQGLLALNSNSGDFERDDFVVSPEVALTGAYHLNECIALTFGYTFIHWNRVAMPGDQIDLTVNPSQITGALSGPARPAFSPVDEDFYVHGINLGVQWIW